jgi:ferrochelatase
MDDMPSRGRTGVILLQLGTPSAPTTAAVRRYLREFLSDRRVVDLPRALWWPILYTAVLTRRPPRSALLYQQVWTDKGSPLLVTTEAQAGGLEARLAAARGDRIPVVVGMRYGEPSIRHAVGKLMTSGVDRILAFPMYPQYAGATTGSSLERLYEELASYRVVPPVRVVPPYHMDTAYIDALAEVARASIAAAPARPEHLVISFHGIPKRYVEEGDPYPVHCAETARLLIRALRWPEDKVTQSFQSRFGREEWLRPYTDEAFVRLGQAKAGIAAMCPGFTADCLETIEEIGMTGRKSFLSAGGRSFHLIPCLNDAAPWIDAMAAIATRELAGWA